MDTAGSTEAPVVKLSPKHTTTVTNKHSEVVVEKHKDVRSMYSVKIVRSNSKKEPLLNKDVGIKAADARNREEKVFKEKTTLSFG